MVSGKLREKLKFMDEIVAVGRQENHDAMQKTI